METDEGHRFAELPPNLARLALALEDGPLTAAEITEKLGLPRRTANDALRRAIAEGLIEAKGDVIPTYSLRGSTRH